MNNTNFTHLWVKSEYSINSSIAKVNDLVWKAKRLGMSSLALTDISSLSGMVKFVRTAEKAEIKPIIGSELICALKSYKLKINSKDNPSLRLVLLAENNEGLNNLIHLVNIGRNAGYYHHPRIDFELLQKYKKGIICLFPYNNDNTLTQKAMGRLTEFMSQNMFIAIQREGQPNEAKHNDFLLSLSQKYSIRLVAVNQVVAVDIEKTLIADVLEAKAKGKKLEIKVAPNTSECYLKSIDDMQTLFADLPEAMENNTLIAENCNITLDTTLKKFPSTNIQTDKSKDERLKEYVWQGLSNKKLAKNPQVLYRIEWELSFIKEKKLADYFLFWCEILQITKEHGIISGPGKGNTAASMVCFALGITQINPLEYGLIPEMFFKEPLITVHIMMDVSHERHSELLDLIQQRFGKERTARTTRWVYMSPYMAVIEAGKVYNFADSKTKYLAKHARKSGIINEGIIKDLKSVINPDTIKMLQTATLLEDSICYQSRHNSVLVACENDFAGILPYIDSKPQRLISLTEHDLEEMRFRNINIMGLKTLTNIDKTLKIIKEQTGLTLLMEDIPDNDSETFDLIKAMDTDDVFQFNSAGMKKMISLVKPDSLQELAAILVLYRPSPLSHELDKQYAINKRTPFGKCDNPYLMEISSILKETHGIVLYHEQFVQMFKLFGLSTLDSLSLLRACGIDKHEEIQKYFQQFINDAEMKGFSRNEAEKLFTDLTKDTDCLLFKAHPLAYALLSYQTAWLKTHYEVIYKQVCREAVK